MSLVSQPTPSRELTVLVDADVLAHKAAYLAESGNLGLAYSIIRDQVSTIEENLKTDRLIMMLSGRKNYRKEYYPEYKQNRKDKPKPRHLAGCIQYIKDFFEYDVQDNMEADDLLGLYQTADRHCNTIIATVDKDLQQIPGLHYNLTSQEVTRVSDIEAENNYLVQCLTGDGVDNIPGIRGIGPKKARAFLEKLDPLMTTQEKMFAIWGFYKERGLTPFDVARCASLVYIHNYADIDESGDIIPRIVDLHGRFVPYVSETTT